jgi:hypothetical protein
MIRWSTVYIPKEFGGLGIINTQIFNECLLTKWIWKLNTQPEQLWVRLLKAKNMQDFKSRANQGSQFWKSLHKIKHLFKWGQSLQENLMLSLARVTSVGFQKS